MLRSQGLSRHPRLTHRSTPRALLPPTWPYDSSNLTTSRVVCVKLKSQHVLPLQRLPYAGPNPFTWLTKLFPPAGLSPPCRSYLSPPCPLTSSASRQFLICTGQVGSVTCMALLMLSFFHTSLGMISLGILLPGYSTTLSSVHHRTPSWCPSDL